MKLLIVGDLHYVGAALHECKIQKRNSRLGIELLKRLRNFPVVDGCDAAVFMGDLVDNGRAEGADGDLAEVKTAADSLGIPCFFVKGNHDCGEDDFRKITGMERPYRVMGDYLLYFFFDRYSEGDLCLRSGRDMLDFRETAERYPDKKILVFQHNPVYPPIESDYPYNLANAGEVRRAYSRCGVGLSVSGHYHDGIDPVSSAGVEYLTAPAFCEAPFAFLELSAGPGGNRAVRHSLKAGPALWDNHCHSEFAYCGEDVSAAAVCERGRLFGLDYVAFTEHAGHLYLSGKDYWSGAYYDAPEIIREARDSGGDRMREYRKKVQQCGAFARLGLEVDSDRRGNLSVLEEDLEGVEILVGAVHFLPEAGAGETKRLFMKANEALVRRKVDAIAHPFRFFRRKKMPVPVDLFRELAVMLGGAGVAAEINYHANDPPFEFFRICLEEGVKISLGTDSHNLVEAGDLSRHLALLRRLGLDPEKDRDNFLVL